MARSVELRRRRPAPLALLAAAPAARTALVRGMMLAMRGMRRVRCSAAVRAWQTAHRLAPRWRTDLAALSVASGCLRRARRLRGASTRWAGAQARAALGERRHGAALRLHDMSACGLTRATA
jgi:hypothetical protein